MTKGIFLFLAGRVFPNQSRFLVADGAARRLYWWDERENGGTLGANDFRGHCYYASGVCLGLRRIVGAAVGFVFVDVAFRLWFGCCWSAGIFLSGRSMWLRP